VIKSNNIFILSKDVKEITKMTKNERMLQMIGKDLFSVANMAAHYDVEIPEEVEDFMMDWFDNDPYEPMEYSFEELKGMAKTVLAIVEENPEIKREPMVKFPLAELEKLVTKTELEMSVYKSEQIKCWDDMDNISSVGGIGGFMAKHANNPELLAAQEVIKQLFG
jgi:hypothetical protein